jgi:endonuclease III
MKRLNINQMLKLLVSTYGDRPWHQRLEPVGELVQTILSQNTSDTNSGRAYASLMRRFGNWEAIADAETSEIAGAIRAGGLADAKAKYIRGALSELKEDSHGFDLEFLHELQVKEAREWLVRLPGVGMKTASCVLLFSLGMPAFPVDTHVYRVVKRLGLIKDKLSVDATHLELEKMVKAGDVYRCHMLIIEHGRKTCKAQRPLCNKCSLADICPSYRIFA